MLKQHKLPSVKVSCIQLIYVLNNLQVYVHSCTYFKPIKRNSGENPSKHRVTFLENVSFNRELITKPLWQSKLCLMSIEMLPPQGYWLILL